MTMVLDPQGRQFGGMGYESNMYSSMHAPNFTDPWAHQTSNHGQFPSMKADTRPAMAMQYQQLPPTSAPVSSGSHYSTQGPDGTHMSYSQELPRSSVSYSDQQYSAPATTGASYSTSYPSMNYAQSLHQQQAQQQRKISSEVYVKLYNT